MQTLLCLVFFLSGAAALLFENLWFQRAGLAFGNSVWASSLVLAAFMGGLALGNGLAGRFGTRVRRPARAYGILELVIAASGLAIVLGLPALNPYVARALRPLVDTPALAHALRLLAAFLLLLVPATAMGATLPLLVAELARAGDRFGHALGRLYGWNTLGAVVGAVAGEAVLLAWLGVRGTACLAAGLNLVAAGGAFAIARRLAAREAGRPASAAALPPLPRRVAPLLAAAFLAGGVLLALEVVWFRFLTLFTLPGSLAFALMLAVVLLGIGLGGLLGGRWLAHDGGAAQLAPALLGAAGLLCVGSYAGFAPVVERLDSTARLAWWGVVVQGLALMLPVSLASGVLFTLLGDALDREAPAGTRSAGLLTLANTTGAMLGALTAGFLLLPGLGIERSLRVLAAVYAGAGFLLWIAALRPRGRARLVTAAAGAAALLAVGPLFPSGALRERYLLVPTAPYLVSNGRIVAVRETLTETLVYVRSEVLGEPHHYRLVTNSHSMSSTLFNAQRYMRLFVWLPVALHPAPRDALLISYGVGTTARALADTPELERIDVVDVSRDIVELNEIVWEDPADYPLRDPRLVLHVEDGRHFLQTSERRYDLITGEPPPPKNAGIVSLYTREFFALAHERLAPGGWLSYWLPVHALRREEAAAVIAAFCAVFEDCSLWSGSGMDWILLGSRGAAGPGSPERFSAQWRSPRAGRALRALGIERPEQLGTLFLAGPEDLRAFVAGTPPLVDDWPKRLGSRPLEVEEAMALWSSWLDPERQRERFASSPLVARLWPPALRESTLPWFDWSREVEDALLANLLEDRNPSRDLTAVDRILDESPLRTLALWRIGSNRDLERAVARAAERGRGGPLIPFTAGARALADREWAGAARAFQIAYGIEKRWRDPLYWWLYALARDGRIAEAARTAAREGVPAGRAPHDTAVWTFLVERFPELGASSAPASYSARTR